MSIERNYTAGEENNQATGGDEKKDNNVNQTGISLPNIDRPDGPFKHSGETARWTKEEKAEKEEQARQSNATGE